MVNTPVLFETFARPEYARQSFDAIKVAKPKVLYFYSNKAREDRPDEIRRNEEVRAFIKEIDWECELHTYFRDEYVDVFTSLWGSLNWFFSCVEEGIILEEDCVPSLAFFDYCEKLLERYRDNSKIRLISGDNFTPEFNPEGYDYFYSHMTHIYGWATWRDRWMDLDRSMSQWDEIKKNKFIRYYPHVLERLYYGFIIDQTFKIKNEEFRSWDTLTIYNMIKNGEVSVVPKYNLVINIGAIGANAIVSNDSVKKDIRYLDNFYSVDTFPSQIEPFDTYDYKHFKKHVLGNFLKYELKKYWKLFFNRKRK